MNQKFRIRETLNLWINADSKANTILEKLQDFLFVLEIIILFVMVVAVVVGGRERGGVDQ